MTETTAASILTSSAYNNIKFIEVQTNLPHVLLSNILNGNCRGAVMAQADWTMAQLNSQSNPFCNLVATGTNIRTISVSKLMMFINDVWLML